MRKEIVRELWRQRASWAALTGCLVLSVLAEHFRRAGRPWPTLFVAVWGLALAGSSFYLDADYDGRTIASVMPAWLRRLVRR